MLFKHVISAATLSTFYEVANASRCKPRTSSSESISTTSSYNSIPSSTYAVSITTSSSFASATSSVAISSTISDSSITSSTESSSIIPSTSSSSSSSAISSSESIIATETASSTSSSEISSSESVSATETISSTISSATSSISSIETSSSITPSSTSSSEIPSVTSSTTSAEPTPTNIQTVTNSGFEIADPITWTFPGYRLDVAATGSLDTDPYSGSRSFIAQGLPGLWQIRLQQTVSVITGQAYTFQYTLKMDPAAGCVMDVLINNVRTRRPLLTQNRGLYNTYTDPWTATSDTATILFSSQCNSGGPTNKLYYDDITLTTVDAPEVTAP